MEIRYILNEIRNILRELRNTTRGHDGITAYLSKNVTDMVVSSILNLSLRCGVFYDEMDLAKVHSLFLSMIMFQQLK